MTYHRHRHPILGSAITLTLLAAATAFAAPNLEFSADSWDFGRIWHGEKPSFKLVLRNTGDEELRIARVHASCSCTAAQPERYVLKPGESTDLTVTYDSTGKQGNNSSKVFVMSNDPDEPNKEFRLDGYVMRAVTVSPKSGLALRAVDVDKPQSVEVTLTNHEPDPMKLEVMSRTGRFDVDLKEVEKGKIWTVRITTMPPMPYGMNQGSVRLKTDVEREPTISLPIRAHMLPRVEASPPAILIHKTLKEHTRRTVRVRTYADQRAFKVLDVHPGDSGIKVDVEPTQPVNWNRGAEPAPKFESRVALTLPPGGDIPDEGVTVKIKTNDPQFSEVEVFVTNNPTDFRKRIGTPRRR